MGSPNILSDEQMAARESVCSALLKCFRSKDDFLLRLVTVDETWVHYHEPENKAQSRQWVGPGFLRPKKFKTQPSAGKVYFGIAKALLCWTFYPREVLYYDIFFNPSVPVVHLVAQSLEASISTLD